jgi:heme/copper-type cytochrome/quinol oxidase subunit 2
MGDERDTSSATHKAIVWLIGFLVLVVLAAICLAVLAAVAYCLMFGPLVEFC